MTSYAPDFYYGYIRGTWPMQYGLLPWPAHLKPRQKGKPLDVGDASPTFVAALPDINLRELFSEPDRPIVADFAPVIEKQGGFIFLTMRENDRPSIGTTIERLINMLDDLDQDPDLEPSLGVPERHPGLGWGGTEAIEDAWRLSANADDREAEDECEDVCEDEGAQQDLEGDNADDEPDLGWCENYGMGVTDRRMEARA